MLSVDQRVSRAFAPAPKPTLSCSDCCDDKISDRDIVPDELQDRLVMLRDTMTSCSFGIGDIANELVDSSASQGLPVTAKRIYSAVGRFCGRSGRTVRYYAETASFYSPETRSEYETLSFAHFVFARQVGDNWREVLEYAVSVPGATVSELDRKFMACQNVDTDHQIETGESCEVSQFIQAIEDATAVTSGLSAVHNNPGADSSRYRLLSATSALRSAINDFVQSVDTALGDKEKYMILRDETHIAVADMNKVLSSVAKIASRPIS